MLHKKDDSEFSRRRSSPQAPDRTTVLRTIMVGRRTPFLWRIPVYALVVATLLSDAGEAIAAIAFPWLVLTLTGSAAWTGIAVASALLPQAFGAVIGGAMVDRFGARSISISAALASAMCLLIMVLLFWHGALNIGIFLTLVFLAEFFGMAVATAWEARLPEISRLARLPLERVNAYQEIAQNASLIVGPPLAGYVTMSLGLEYAVTMIAGVAIIFSVFNVFFMPRSRQRTGHAREPMKLAYIGAALRLLRGDPLLRFIVLFTTILLALMVTFIEVVLPTFFFRQTGDALDLGVFVSAAGGGGIISAVAYGMWGTRVPHRTCIVTGMIGFSIGTAVIAAMPSFSWLLFAGFVIGLASGPLEPLVNSVVQKRTPSVLRGRVLGVTTALVLVAAPIAAVVAGIFVEIVGVQPLMIGIVVLLLLLTIVSYRVRVLQQHIGTRNIR